MRGPGIRLWPKQSFATEAVGLLASAGHDGSQNPGSPRNLSAMNLMNNFDRSGW